MRILVLGGTEFVGRALVDEALARGHEVTTLNRGHHRPDPRVTSLRGDRRQPDGLAALAQDTWDAVVDTWSREPYVVNDSARALRDRVGRYAYISTCSVYAYPSAPGRTETAPLVEGDPEAGRDGSEVEYGEAKRGAEIAVEQAFGDRYAHARAGLILGPHENVGRLPWWLARTARGGDVLAPGPEDLALQYIDARDLAGWAIGAAEQELSGAYNLVSPPGFTTIGEFLRACAEVTGSDARLRWAGPETLVAEGITGWIDLPVWLPPGDDYVHLHTGNVDKALATGLRNRPVGETVADTWAWFRQTDGTLPHRPGRPALGLDPEREQEILNRI